MDKNDIVRIYRQEHSINGTARQTGLSHNKIKKILITECVLKYDKTDDALKRIARGESTADIAAVWGVAPNAVNNYLPYSRPIYNFNQTKKAQQLQSWRKNKKER